MDHIKIINWSYFKVDNKDMYFGFRWKKQAYKDTLRYTQQKINQEVSLQKIHEGCYSDFIRKTLITFIKDCHEN